MRVGCTTAAVLLLLAATPASAMAGRWSIVKVRSVAGQKDGSLSSVSCVAPSACVAAGGYTNSRGISKGLIERWGGTAFSFQPSPSPVHPAFLGVSCPARSFCTGVGSPYTLWAEQLRHGSWRYEHVPALPGRLNTLRAVSCPSRRLCVAVGFVAYKNDNSDPSAAIWNGHRWSVKKLPEPRNAGDGGELSGVSCPTTRDCLAVGNVNLGTNGRLLAERWNGRRWSLAQVATPRGSNIELNGISCVSASWCEAVGDLERNDMNDLGLVEHWDGKRLRVQNAPAPPGAEATQYGFNAVSCSARGSCMAAGGTSLGTLGITLTERLRHGRWSRQRTPNPRFGGQLFGISCSRNGACLAVGNQQTYADPFAPTAQLAEKYS